MNRGLGDGVAVAVGCGSVAASTETTRPVLHKLTADVMRTAAETSIKRLICIK
jgi:hypothetical protein